MHAADCSYRLGLACSCGAGDPSEDALNMQAFLTGWISAGLYGLKSDESPLKQPVVFEQIDAKGVIVLRLASGLIASIAVHVE
jgi:hypothetical protein